PLIRTNSSESYYLKGRVNDYATALVDFDGNERSSIHLRNSDLNVLHILFQQLQRSDLPPPARKAATDEFFRRVDANHAAWRKDGTERREERDELQGWTETQDKLVAAQPLKFTPDQIALGVDKLAHRIDALDRIAKETETSYRHYLSTLNALLALRKDGF